MHRRWWRPGSGSRHGPGWWPRRCSECPAGVRRSDAYTRLMLRLRRALALGAVLLGSLSLAIPAFAADDHVVRLELQGVIDQVNAAYIEQGLATAAEGGAAAALLEIDSPGGELTSMNQIIKAILGSGVPVITYVTPEGAQAGSAATFITLAGDVAAMAPSTTIGAASVVGSGGA